MGAGPNSDSFDIYRLSGPLCDAMSGAWASFAHTGAPGGAKPGWPEYGQERNTLVLDAEPRLEADPRREVRQFFEGVRPLPAN